MRTIDNINDLNKSDFLSIFGNVFEKTESVAMEAFESKPFKNFEDIVFKMLNIYENYEYSSVTIKRYSCFSSYGSSTLCWKEIVN